ncbi:NADH:ubiquinone reductase (Na(+)-transporting) subunit D [Fusibacter bizertensis]|uniref:NADH:ubiquinone reductase (Na(+)-transporting) subunit D n=1 Tax=Fusibacter bizertensis TaxID=1488331 RepID=A0ABT6NG82_9FIRM|nr:NADH:ubiquinone reductase (Na(+)-transporting) subunit D [Fusibacter bizertensis]MDH8679432.1 NADH:ubiquinone reductase (Na(+)-transporting) subunit D [Fusibacter bizertensis]
MKEVMRVVKAGIYKDNPVFRQILGICSSLAVTNLLTNSFVMGVGLMFVTAFSSFTVSLIRVFTPKHIRMMVQTLIISAYVIMLDIFLKAYFPSMSKALGPYVGLIITNCIIMGRAEAFAQNNKPFISFIDGLMMGVGYTIVLMAVAFVRELLGFGSLFGIQILGDGWVNWTLMIMPPGAFFMIGIVIWASSRLFPKEDQEKGGAKV